MMVLLLLLNFVSNPSKKTSRRHFSYFSFSVLQNLSPLQSFREFYEYLTFSEYVTVCRGISSSTQVPLIILYCSVNIYNKTPVFLQTPESFRHQHPVYYSNFNSNRVFFGSARIFLRVPGLDAVVFLIVQEYSF